MAGNVARIISDDDFFNKENSINSSDNLDSAMAKIARRKMAARYSEIDSIGTLNEYIIKNQALLEIHDAQIIEKNKQARIVKGGSWATGPAYMLCGRREVFPQDKGSSRIGFRLAMIKLGNLKPD